MSAPAAAAAALFALVLVAACLSTPALARSPATIDIADYATRRYPTMKGIFPLWLGSVRRYHEEEHHTGGACLSRNFDRCHYKKWQFVLGNLKGRPPLEVLRGVNAFMNNYRYIKDLINWHVVDYWATPGQFLGKNGDCEDYAIAKYFSLRALGWPAEALRIVVVDNLNARVAHAILSVRLDKQLYILDNIVRQVRPSSKVYHYRPIYGLNETAAWRYKPMREH